MRFLTIPYNVRLLVLGLQHSQWNCSQRSDTIAHVHDAKRTLSMDCTQNHYNCCKVCVYVNMFRATFVISAALTAAERLAARAFTSTDGHE